MQVNGSLHYCGWELCKEGRLKRTHKRDTGISRNVIFVSFCSHKLGHWMNLIVE